MFRKKIDPKAESAAKMEKDIKTIEGFFPKEKGISSFLSNNDHLKIVTDIATGKAEPNSRLFLKMLGYNPDDAGNIQKFQDMLIALKDQKK